MNSSVLHFLWLLLLLPVPAFSQQIISGESPARPVNLLGSPPGQGRFLKFSYTSPYGITNLSDAGLLYQKPAGGGRIMIEGSWAGIPGFYQYGAGMGYVLKAGPGLEGGVFINAALLPALNSSPRRIRPASSLFLGIDFNRLLVVNIFCDQWAGFWIFGHTYLYRPSLSMIFRAALPEDFEITGGFSYPKGGSPVILFGLSVTAGQGHTVLAGIQTGPAGFWTGYRLEAGGLEFVFALSAGGIFGLEPGSSVKYYFD